MKNTNKPNDNWETVADFTKIQKEGVLANVILARLKGYGKKKEEKRARIRIIDLLPVNL